MQIKTETREFNVYTYVSDASDSKGVTYYAVTFRNVKNGKPSGRTFSYHFTSEAERDSKLKDLVTA